MSEQIYVITSGSFSDYGIVAILSGEPGQSMEALYQTFQYETSKPRSRDYPDETTWRENLSDQYGITRDMQAPDGRTWKSHANEEELFIEWIRRDGKFKVFDYDETNLDL